MLALHGFLGTGYGGPDGIASPHPEADHPGLEAWDLTGPGDAPGVKFEEGLNHRVSMI